MNEKNKRAINEMNIKNQKMKELTLFFKRYYQKFVIISDTSNLKDGKIIYMEDPNVGLFESRGDFLFALGGIIEWDINTNTWKNSEDSCICLNSIRTISETYDTLEECIKSYLM